MLKISIFFRLDLAQSTPDIIEALNPNYQDLDASLLEANGNELGENINSIRGLHGHVHGDGFQIRDHLSPSANYQKVTPAGRPEPRPVPYAIRAVENTEYTEFFKACSEETQALNSPSINDPLYACQWHLESSEFVDINAESAWEAGAKGEGVNVALVDRGIDYRHEDLKDNVNVALNHDYSVEGEIYNRYQHH